MFAGDTVFYAQGHSCTLVEHSGGELVVTAEDGFPSRSKFREIVSTCVREN